MTDYRHQLVPPPIGKTAAGQDKQRMLINLTSSENIKCLLHSSTKESKSLNIHLHSSEDSEDLSEVFQRMAQIRRHCFVLPVSEKERENAPLEKRDEPCLEIDKTKFLIVEA